MVFEVFDSDYIDSSCIIIVFITSTGDVHVGMVDRGGQLEVEVNQARGLTAKPGSKNIPGTLKLTSPTPLKVCSLRSFVQCVSHVGVSLCFVAFVCSDLR